MIIMSNRKAPPIAKPIKAAVLKPLSVGLLSEGDVVKPLGVREDDSI